VRSALSPPPRNPFPWSRFLMTTHTSHELCIHVAFLSFSSAPILPVELTISPPPPRRRPETFFFSPIFFVCRTLFLLNTHNCFYPPEQNGWPRPAPSAFNLGCEILSQWHGAVGAAAPYARPRPFWGLSARPGIFVPTPPTAGCRHTWMTSAIVLFILYFKCWRTSIPAPDSLSQPVSSGNFL